MAPPLSPEVAICIHNLRKEWPKRTWANIGALFGHSEEWAISIRKRYDGLTGLPLKAPNVRKNKTHDLDVVIERYAMTFRDSQGKEIAEAMGRSGLKVTRKHVMRRLKALGFERVAKALKLKDIPVPTEGNETQQEQAAKATIADLSVNHPRRIDEWVRTRKPQKLLEEEKFAKESEKAIKRRSRHFVQYDPESRHGPPTMFSRTPVPKYSNRVSKSPSQPSTSQTSTSAAALDSRPMQSYMVTFAPTSADNAIFYLPSKDDPPLPVGEEEEGPEPPRKKLRAIATCSGVGKSREPKEPVAKFRETLNINHFPESVRKRVTCPLALARIAGQASAMVRSEGTYFAPDEDVPEGAQQLSLIVEANTEQALLRAKAAINRFCCFSDSQL